MPPNGSTSTLSMSADHANTHFKQPAMDTVDSPPTDLTLATPTTSSGSSPLNVVSTSPPLLQPGMNMKIEADRRRTYENWRVTFMDPNLLSAAGFYYTNLADVVRCAFCGVEVGRWEEGDEPLRDHQRWSPSCGFMRGLMVGNIPVGSDGQPGTSSSSNQETSRSHDVCGPYMELRPHSGPERGSMVNQSLLTPAEMQRHGINQCRGPQHRSYNTYEARLCSYESWPRSLKQKPDKLSEAGFFYTGKGDQTVCFYCGGGLRDWEETDDPWVEHATWFPKCMHVVLIKGQAFIEDCRRLKEPKVAVKSGVTRLSYNTGSFLQHGSEAWTSVGAQPGYSSSTERPLCAWNDYMAAAVSSRENEVYRVQQEDQTGLPGDTQKVQASSASTQSAPQAPVHTPQVNGSEEKVIDDARLCQICFVEERGVVFLPCGHLVACVRCAPSLSTCAVCRQPLTGTVRAFLS